MTLSDAWVDFIAGWASGAVAVLTCQPVDTVLTRLQAGPAVVTVVVPASSNAATTSSREITANLVRTFGVSSLWRGSSPMISAVPFQNSLLMGGYGVGKQWAAAAAAEDERSGDNNNNNNNNNNAGGVLLPVFVGGCTGGIVQSFLMSPVEYVKIRQQVAATNGAAAEALATASRQMFRGAHSNNLWSRGLSATLLRDGIPHGVWFASYEWCKNVMMMTTMTTTTAEELEAEPAALPGGAAGDMAGGTAYRQLAVPIVSGAFAATTAWAVGYPFDIIKTRIQAASGGASSSSSSSPPLGIYGTAVQLVAEADGRVVAGLYRGFGLKLVRAVPASMIGFTTYEWVAGRLR